jgi:hypothetical protein
MEKTSQGACNASKNQTDQELSWVLRPERWDRMVCLEMAQQRR